MNVMAEYLHYHSLRVFSFNALKKFQDTNLEKLVTDRLALTTSQGLPSVYTTWKGVDIAVISGVAGIDSGGEDD